MTIKNKYYRWRRRRLREQARNRRKITTYKYSYLTSHMTQKELKKYNDFGLKWYKTLGLTFGTDVTGLELSKMDLTRLSHLNDYERADKPIPSVPDTHIDVTFQTLTDEDGTKYTLVLDNGVPRPGGTAYELYLKQQDKD